MPDKKEQPFSLWWLSTQRGISNPPHVRSDRTYHGLVFRLSGDIHPKDPKFIEWNEQTLSDLEAKAITKSCANGGEFAAGEVVERYDCFDIDNGDWLTMYRVPYRGTGAARPEWATTLDRQRRRLGKNVYAALAAPPNLSEEGRKLTGLLLRVLDKGKLATTGKGNEHAEQNALALMTVAAGEISKLPVSDHREAIIEQMGRWLGWLVEQNDNPPEQPTHTYEIPESDNDDRTN